MAVVEVGGSLSPEYADALSFAEATRDEYRRTGLIPGAYNLTSSELAEIIAPKGAHGWFARMILKLRVVL